MTYWDRQTMVELAHSDKLDRPERERSDKLDSYTRKLFRLPFLRSARR